MKRGSSVDLLVLADSLDRVEARGALTKSGRSYALAVGSEQSPFKAGSIELKPDMQAAEAFQIVARACVRHIHFETIPVGPCWGPFLLFSRSMQMIPA